MLEYTLRLLLISEVIVCPISLLSVVKGSGCLKPYLLGFSMKFGSDFSCNRNLKSILRRKPPSTHFFYIVKILGQNFIWKLETFEVFAVNKWKNQIFKDSVRMRYFAWDQSSGRAISPQRSTHGWYIGASFGVTGICSGR